MLDTIAQLLPSKQTRLALLMILLTAGGGWIALYGVQSISAYAKEEVQKHAKIIITDEVKTAATEAATEAAKKAARSAAQEVQLDRDALEQKIAEQNVRIRKMEADLEKKQDKSK